MKSIYKILAIALVAGGLFTENVKAQAFWGVYGGINTASLTMSGYKPDEIGIFNTKPTFEDITRVTMGITCELPFRKSFIFQPELALVQKGGIVTLDSGYEASHAGLGNMYVSTVNNLTLNYLAIPLLFKWRFQINHPSRMYPHENTGRPFFGELYGGPVFNYLIMPKSDYSYTVDYENANTNEDENYKKRGSTTQTGLSAIDVSFAVGASIRWNVTRRTSIWLDARYTMNFLDINKEFIYSNQRQENGEFTKHYPTIKNGGNLAITLGISTTFTKRRYWDHPRMKKRRF